MKKRSFPIASDGTCSIEFYCPTKEVVEHEFKHYVDWLGENLNNN